MTNTDILNVAKQLAAVCDGELPFCECGKCGLRVAKEGNRFIHGHHRRGTTHLVSSETCKKISDAKKGVLHTSKAQIAADEAKRGVPRTSDAQIAADKAKLSVPLSPEHCAAIAEANRNSDAVKYNVDKMRGGNDFVTHHHIYNESDLSLNTVQMTRSDHMSLHQLLRKLGYIVPHINVKKDGCDDNEY